MAFLSRLFKRDARTLTRDGPPAEREEARRQGVRDARLHPLSEFTDPEFQPAYVTGVRALAREQVAEIDRRLATVRTALLEQAVEARERIMGELGHGGTRPEPHPPVERRTAEGFITLEEARARRAEARRRQAAEEAHVRAQRERARVERLQQEWESALMDREHQVEAVHARTEQLIAAYKAGVLEAHPRKEEIPSLWKGEVIAAEPTGGTALGASGREEIGRIRREIEERIEAWHAEVLPRELPTELPAGLPAEPHLGLPAELAAEPHAELPAEPNAGLPAQLPEEPHAGTPRPELSSTPNGLHRGREGG